MKRAKIVNIPLGRHPFPHFLNLFILSVSLSESAKGKKKSTKKKNVKQYQNQRKFDKEMDGGKKNFNIPNTL